MTNDQEIDIHERLTRIESNTTNLNESIIILNARLFGNGQPGAFKRIEDRVQAEEDFTSRAKGALAVLGFVGFASLAHIFGWLKP